MTRSFIARLLVGAGLAGIAAVTVGNVRRRGTWTTAELATLRSLSLRSLEPLDRDPSNRYDNDPRAAALGRDLFFDTRLSGNGKVSCGTCHVATQDFQDGKPLA
ncbi:MAG TPA: cytochrome c peroxidase, partial [Gemmatimonadaceae bacterium]